MRIKYRYFLMTLNYTDCDLAPDLVADTLHNTIIHAIHDQYGEVGLGHALGQVKVKYLAVLTGTVLLRVPADYEKQCRVSVASIVVVGKKRCVLNVVHVGGTIRSCQKKLVSYNVNKLHRQMLDAKDSKEKEYISQVLEKTIKDINSLCF